MRYFITSDIHSNLEALQAVMKDMGNSFQFNKSQDNFVCLGDIVGYAADPEDCMNLIYKNANIILPGNHDQGTHWTITGENKDFVERHFNYHAIAGLNYSAKHLSPKNRARLAELLEKDKFVYETENLIFTHSQPLYPKDMSIYIEEMSGAKQYFFAAPEFDGKIAFVGHRHIPQIYLCRSDEIEFKPDVYEGGEVSSILSGGEPQGKVEPWLCSFQKNANKPFDRSWNLSSARMALIQVPSVGQPRDNCAYTGYALYDSSKKELIMRRLPYDIDSTQAKIRKAGLPRSLADRLPLGR